MTPLTSTGVVNIGLIGLDTSHVQAFAELLHDDHHPHHVGGARIVAAFPGGSADFPLSRDRVPGYAQLLRQRFGADICATPQQVCERADLLFITAVDGRAHRQLYQQTVRFSLPTFIDKPFTTELRDALAIVALAQEHGVTTTSGSSIPFADELTDALDRRHEATLGPIVGCEVFGPTPRQSPLPGLFWYGIHSVDVLYRVMGEGCEQVTAWMTEAGDVIAARWADGRTATLHGRRQGHARFGVTIHRAQRSQFVDLSAPARPPYAAMLERLLADLPAGRAPVPLSRAVETVRFIEAAHRAAEQGRAVAMADGAGAAI